MFSTAILESSPGIFPLKPNRIIAMPNPPKPCSHLLLAACFLLMLPMVTFAQFTGIVLSARSDATLPDFSPELGEALELAFDSTDHLAGSFGSLDRGFGTYLAPRMDPAQRRHRLFFHLEPVDETSGPGPARRGKSLLTSEPSLLALSAAKTLSNESATRNQFARAGFGSPSGISASR